MPDLFDLTDHAAALQGARRRCEPRQTREVHPAHVMHLRRLHPGAVGGDDAAQVREEQRRPVFRQQSAGGEPAAAFAAVARYLQHGEPRRNLAERHNARAGVRRCHPPGRRSASHLKYSLTGGRSGESLPGGSRPFLRSAHRSCPHKPDFARQPPRLYCARATKAGPIIR
jgi:hypothetical protein